MLLELWNDIARCFGLRLQRNCRELESSSCDWRGLGDERRGWLPARCVLIWFFGPGVDLSLLHQDMSR